MKLVTPAALKMYCDYIRSQDKITSMADITADQHSIDKSAVLEIVFLSVITVAMWSKGASECSTE